MPQSEYDAFVLLVQNMINSGNLKGRDGIGISSVVINDDGELVLTYSNEQIVNLGKVVGDATSGTRKMLTVDGELNLRNIPNGAYDIKALNNAHLVFSDSKNEKKISVTDGNIFYRYGQGSSKWYSGVLIGENIYIFNVNEGIFDVYELTEYINFFFDSFAEFIMQSYPDSETIQNAIDIINEIKDTVAHKDRNNNFTSSQTINGTLAVNGDIVQNGDTYETHAEQVYTKNDEIITREGAVGGLSEGQLTGVRAEKYDGDNDGQLGFDANGEARVGDVGDTQPLLTRDEIANLQSGQVLVWDGEKLRAVGSSNFVKNTDFASSSKNGIIGLDYGSTSGLFMSTAGGNGENKLRIKMASHSDIDNRTANDYFDNGVSGSNKCCPIVPANLDYAVDSVLKHYNFVTFDDLEEMLSMNITNALGGAY